MFDLKIISPEKVIYESDVLSLIAPGLDGYFGILSNHERLISLLKPGNVIIKDANGKEERLEITAKSIFKILNNRALILVQ